MYDATKEKMDEQVRCSSRSSYPVVPVKAPPPTVRWEKAQVPPGYPGETRISRVPQTQQPASGLNEMTYPSTLWEGDRRAGTGMASALAPSHGLGGWPWSSIVECVAAHACGFKKGPRPTTAARLAHVTFSLTLSRPLHFQIVLGDLFTQRALSFPNRGFNTQKFHRAGYSFPLCKSTKFRDRMKTTKRHACLALYISSVARPLS